MSNLREFYVPIDDLLHQYLSGIDCAKHCVCCMMMMMMMMVTVIVANVC